MTLVEAALLQRAQEQVREGEFRGRRLRILGEKRVCAGGCGNVLHPNCHLDTCRDCRRRKKRGIGP